MRALQTDEVPGRSATSRCKSAKETADYESDKTTSIFALTEPPSYDTLVVS